MPSNPFPPEKQMRLRNKTETQTCRRLAASRLDLRVGVAQESDEDARALRLGACEGREEDVMV